MLFSSVTILMVTTFFLFYFCYTVSKGILRHFGHQYIICVHRLTVAVSIFKVAYIGSMQLCYFGYLSRKCPLGYFHKLGIFFLVLYVCKSGYECCFYDALL